MMKKTISLFLVFAMIFVLMMSTDAYGLDMNRAKCGEKDVINILLDDDYKEVHSNDYLQREVKEKGIEIVKFINYVLGVRKIENTNCADLTIDKAGTVVENRTVKNLHITKEVGDGEVVLRNVKVTGELLVEGGGQNSIKIEDSTINKLTTNKKDGKVRILVEGNTSVDITSVKSTAILELKKLTGNGFKEVKVNEHASVLLSIDKKVKWKSSNNKVASIDEKGAVSAINAGEAVISVEARDGRETEICELNVTEPGEIITNKKDVRILTIGNSFSQDASQYIYDIAKSAGVNVIVGNIYFAGCSLKTHWTNASKNSAAYSYYKWTSSGMIMREMQTIKDCILDEQWDYIVLQQSSGESGLYNTFQPYLNKLAAYAKGLSTNSNVKLALHMTWAYAADSTHDKFINYSNDQMTMFNSIINAYEQAMADTNIDILIPSGTAIQNARTNENLCGVGDELTVDGYHLNEGIGRYIAAMTYFETLVAKHGNINKDLFADVTFFPDRFDSNAQLSELSKVAVSNAVMNPFKITEVKN